MGPLTGISAIYQYITNMNDKYDNRNDNNNDMEMGT
jgi:hypothetical protein